MKRTDNEPLVLTESEQSTLEMIKQGLEEDEIALKLGISRHTVKSHKNKLMQLKLL